LSSGERRDFSGLRSKRLRLKSVFYRVAPQNAVITESRVVSELKAKRDEIQRAILDHEQKVKTARADLATLNETLAIYGEF